MIKNTCDLCNKKFTSDKERRFCVECSCKRGTTNYKVWSVVVIVFGIIIGIILGATQTTLKFEDNLTDYKEVFNISIMLYTWFITFVLSFAFSAVHSICYRLDLLNNKE